MTDHGFVKHYRDPARAVAARAHRDWLDSLDSGVRIPAIRASTPHTITFDHLGHRHPGPDDLDELARTLGRLHAAAHTRHLLDARPDQPFTTDTGLVIPDFASPRRTLLTRMPVPYLDLPVTLYKDANIRNFVLTDEGAAIVDFDDLTLAPFGYDLAKLVVSTAMTYGLLGAVVIERALAAYNATVAAAGLTTSACPLDRLRLYAEFHHLATQRYLRRNGYAHRWSDVRPWPSPDLAAGAHDRLEDVAYGNNARQVEAAVPRTIAASPRTVNLSSLPKSPSAADDDDQDAPSA